LEANSIERLSDGFDEGFGSPIRTAAFRCIALWTRGVRLNDEEKAKSAHSEMARGAQHTDASRAPAFQLPDAQQNAAVQAD